MADSLTIQFKEELRKRGKVATDSQIEAFLSKHRTQSQIPVNVGGSLYNNVSEPQFGSWYTGEPATSEDKIDLIEGVGSALWHFADTAAFGLPGIALRKMDVDPLSVIGKTGDYEKTGISGKVGAVVGEAAGFLVPMKWVSKGVQLAVKAKGKLGTTRIVDDILEGTGSFRETKGVLDKGVAIGFERETLKKTFKTELRSTDSAEALATYGISNEAIKTSSEVLRTNLSVALKKRFKDADDLEIDRLVSGVVDNLGKPGLHVNSVGVWVQRMLGRKLNMSESKWISKYAAHATEMSVNFSLYNLLTDGVQSMAGEKEFDPVGDVYHALLFSAFLPFVETLPGGGKIPIRQTMMKLNKLKKVYNDSRGNYSQYSPEALSGILKMITRDNFLKNRSSWGDKASTYAWQDLKNLDKKQLVDIFDEIHDIAGLDKIWKEFLVESGKDLGASVGRMMAGAFYFNAETLLDKDLLYNVEPEVLGAHMLIGAVFTRMRKNIFAEKNPTITNFEKKLDLLRNLGIEAESAEFWNSHYENRHITAGALSGVMGNKEVSSIYNIIYGSDVLESISNEARKKRTKEDPELGEELNNNPDLNLLLYAKDIADIRRFSEGVGEGKEPDLIDLKHLTRSQALNLVERLKEVEINDKGEKLTEDNFDDFYTGLERSLLKSGSQRIVDTLFAIANELGIQTQGSAKDFRLDGQTVSFEDIKGRKPDKTESIAEYQYILNKLKAWGYIGTIKSPPGTEKEYKNFDGKPDSERIQTNVKNLLKAMTDKLVKDNFSEGTSLDILASENAWLDLMGRHRTRQLLSLTRNVVRGDKLTDVRISTLHDSFLTVFKQDMPTSSFKTLIDILNKAPEGMSKKEWEGVKATEEYSILLDNLQTLARIWASEGRNTEGINRKKDIPYEDALALVGSVEQLYPDMFRDNFLDRFEVYHQQREFRDARLGLRESGIIRFARDHNVLVKSANDSKWTFLGIEQAREILSRREGLFKKEDVDAALAKYDEIRKSLSRIDGKYISFENHMELEGLNRSDLLGFITNAHTLTKESQRDILGAYKDLSKKTSEQGKVLQTASDIVSRLYDHEANEMKSLTLKEVEDMTRRLDELLEIADPVGWIADQRMVDYLKLLRGMLSNWQKGYKEGDVFVGSDDIWENGELTMGRRSDKLNRIRRTIQDITLNAVGSLNGARHAGRIKQELIASFTQQLRDLKIDIPEGITLSQLYEQYGYEPIEPPKKGQTDRSIDSFASEIDTKLIAFESNMSPEQLASLNQEIARNRNMFSTPDNETPSVTYQSIENQYGIFNKNLTGEDFMSMRMDLEQAVTDKKSSKVREAGTSILREVHEAIDKKHDGDLTKSIAEKLEFNKRFPLVLAQAYGTEMVKVISFSENGLIKDKNQVELIIENKREASGKDASFQREFQDIGLDIYKVGRASVWGNRTFNDIGDIPLTTTEKNGYFEIPGRVRDDIANAEYSTFTGAKVTTGKFDQIYVRLDQLGSNKKVAEAFKKKFNDWYDDMISGMDKGTRENFEIMYKGWRQSELPITEKGPVRELIKAQYWSHLSRQGFIDLISAANSREAMNELGVSLLKYFHTMSTGGPKIQGSREFLRSIHDIGNKEIADGREWWGDRQHASQWGEVAGAIRKYLRPGRQKFNVVSVADESMKGFSALEITRKLLIKEAANFAPGTETRNAYEELITILPEKFKSLANSGINAQSWLGTDAAHLIYLHRGRNIFDDLAGVKPVGESSMQDILLKTNFVYDKDIADLMKRAKIDILTTQSAAKRFGPGNTILEIGQGSERRRMETEDFNSYSDAFFAAESSLREGAKGELRIEDLYLGKTTDRKKLASVSYSLTNFLDAIGYGEFTKHVGYYGKLRELLGEHAEIKNEKSMRRNALFSNTLNIARDRGEIFEDGAYGSVDRLVNSGVDVQSTLLASTADMMIVRRILGEVSKPGTKYGSYSVLVPFLEGTPSVYKEIGGVDKQIKFGGKKLSYFDGEQNINDWKNVKFIVSFRDPIVKTKKDGKDVLIGGKNGHDIQVSIKGGELVVTDPYKGTEHAVPAKLLKRIQQRILVIRHQLNNQFSNNPTYKQIFDHLRAKNTFDNKIGGYEVDMFIHSLSLRIPNIGGDVAVHRVEGFYDKSFGNVVGVNAMDLAVKHQADFDVDMLNSLHDMPHKLVDSISKNLGKTPDAHTYPADDMSNLDMFNMGEKIGQVGKLKEVDTLEPHYNRWRNAQNLFGSVMNISPALGSMNRLEFNILGLPEIKSKGMMDMSDGLFKPHQQRLKNVLQSIVDATKEDNFVSRANREDVLKYVLFAKPFGGENGSKLIDGKLREFYEDGVNAKGQEKWTGVFDLTEFAGKGDKKLIMEDAIIEIMNIMNSSNRVLSGVTDEAGRRPPDLRQMMHIRSDINSMFRDVNQAVFNKLLFNYRVLNRETKGDLVGELVDMFFGSHQEDYSNRNALFNDIYKRSKRMPSVQNHIFSLRRDPPSEKGKPLPDGEKNLHKIGVGGIILDMFGTRLNDKPGWVTRAKSKDTQKAHDLLDKIESAFMLGSEVNLQEAITAKEFARVAEEKMTENLYGDFGKLFFKELESYDMKNIQDYSLLYHVLDKESSSLRNFVSGSRGNRTRTNAVMRAQYKLRVFEAAKDHLLSKENDMVDRGRKSDEKTPMQKFFKFQDLDLTKRKRGILQKNRSREVQYVYSINTTAGARVKYTFVGAISPLSNGKPGSRWLRTGRKYVIMRNPIRYELMTNRDVQDAYSLLEVTGEALPQHISGYKESSDAFHLRLGQLKRDFFELNTETFKMSKKSAFAQRNWMDAKRHEDNMIDKFFNEIMNLSDGTPQAIHTIASIIMKPTATTGMVRLTAHTDAPILLPSFKINRRLVLAVERYLHRRWNESEIPQIYDSLFGAYGRAFRRKVNRIMYPTEEGLYRSDLYANDNLYKTRDPLLDLAFDKIGFLYMPNIRQAVRGSLRQYGGQQYKSYDAFGNVRRMISYDDLGPRHSHQEHYAKQRHYEDGIDAGAVCH